MREILFRGKRLDNGEWVEGDLWDGNSVMIFARDGFPGGPSWNEVDPATVGQFTGLLDKQGKRIFEGDLVIPTNRRRLTNKPQVVEYCPLSGYWQCAPAREPVVIGNIYDTPELQEVTPDE